MGRVNNVHAVTGSRWLAVGGIRDQMGWIMRTNDAGKHWDKVATESEKSLYCVAFIDSMHGFAGGDFLHIWETFDGGEHWEFHWLADQVPYNEQDRPALRSIDFPGNGQGYMAGGENLGEGVIYFTPDSGTTWNFIFDQHEFRDLDFLPNGNGVVAGHGRIMETNTGFEGLHPLDIEGDFFTSIRWLNASEIIAAGYNGGIYRSANAGLEWKEVLRSNGIFDERTNWNAIETKNSLITVVGNSGKIARSGDGGNHFTLYELEGHPNLYSIAYAGDQLVCGSEDGTIYTFVLP